MEEQIKEILSFLSTNKDALTIILTSIGGVIALATLIKAILEYRIQGKQKRAELFEKYKVTLRTEKRLSRISSLLEGDSEELSRIPKDDRYYFLGFYEKIAIATNSKLIRKEISHYMFSYFAIACYDSENFWKGINKESYYWKVFIDYAVEMKKIQKNRLRGRGVDRKIKF